jgi:hypothetical protein
MIMRGAAPDKTNLLFDLLFDPAHFIMERKMMFGIKQRAEMGSSMAPSPSSPESNPDKSCPGVVHGESNCKSRTVS